MSTSSEPGPAPATPGRSAMPVVNPFLHADQGRIYDPLSDRAVPQDDPLHPVLAALRAGTLAPASLDDALRSRLEREGWLLPADRDPARLFRLKVVSLETHTICNQACYFCPVAYEPRAAEFMPTELFDRIVGELSAFRETIGGVLLMNYNEPTVDRRFVSQVAALFDAGLPPGVLSNGSGLTPDKVDAILAKGMLRYLSINLSTLDRERYAADRGKDQLEMVLANLDYLKDKPLAIQTDMAVLGKGDAVHKADYEAIRERFAGSRFDVRYFEVMDRAGILPVGLALDVPRPRLRGCENVGSRPLQHLHITPQGRCVLCCEDYGENHVVGDLRTQSVAEVLVGDGLARYRRWIYGLEEAPADFMCRKCIFSLPE